MIVGLGGARRSTEERDARVRARAPGSDRRPVRRADAASRRRKAVRSSEGCDRREGQRARAPPRGDGRAQAVRRSRGAGAAGGLGAALAALGADLVPGAPTLLDLVGFDETSSRATTSSSRARGRSTRRPPRERRRERSRDGARSRASAVSSSADAYAQRSPVPRRLRSQASRTAPGRTCSISAGARRGASLASPRFAPNVALPRLGRHEAVGHRLEQLPRDFWARLHEGSKHEDGQPVRLDIRTCGHGGGSGPAVDQRDLAERRARTDRRDLLAWTSTDASPLSTRKNINPPRLRARSCRLRRSVAR